MKRKTDGLTRQQRWRKKWPEKYRAYQAAYMRKWRKRKKGQG